MPAAVITAFWALESDFGVGMGNMPVLRSLATLAYDCRRGDMFRAELMAALQIIDRGDLRADEMIGSWAGELGQTQFLPIALPQPRGRLRRRRPAQPAARARPTSSARSADFITASAGSAASRGCEEVRVPASLAWDQADLADPASALAVGEPGA